MRLALVLLLLLTGMQSKAQDKCYVPINKKRIASNANLDYFINRLKNDSFTIGYDRGNIPEYIKGTVNCLLDTLAHPEEHWNETCMHLDGWPDRCLTLFATNQHSDVFLIIYATGGIARTDHVMLLRLKKRGIRLNNLKTVEDIWVGQGFFRGKTIPEVVTFLNEIKEEGDRVEDYIYY